MLDTARTVLHDSTFLGYDLERFHDFHVVTSESELLIQIDGDVFDVSLPPQNTVYVAHRGTGEVRFADERVEDLGNEYSYQSFPDQVPLDGSPLQFSIVDPAWFDADTMRVSFPSVSGRTRILRPMVRDTLSRTAALTVEWQPGQNREAVQITLLQNVDFSVGDTTLHSRDYYTVDDGVFEICSDELRDLPAGYYDLTLARGHAASGMSPIHTSWYGTAMSVHTVTVFVK